jgi:hypothetical protein
MNFLKLISGCFIGLIAISATAPRSFALQSTNSKAYYVNLSGNDKNSGSKTAPFKTIGKINSLHLLAGDTVYFRSAQRFNGSLSIAQIKGSFKKPVVITSYGVGKGIVDARDSTAIKVYQCSYIKIRHLTLMGSGRKQGNVKDGLAIVNCNKIGVDDLDISGFQKSGLLIFSSQGIIAKKVFVHNNGSAGITVEGPYQTRKSRDIQILNCRAENNPGDPTNLKNHSGNGIIVGNCSKVLIDHCTATNNGWDMPRIGNGPVGIWAYEADSVTIQYCLAYRNKTSKGGGDGGGFDFDGGVANSVIQYCLSYENQGGGYCIFQYAGASPWHHNIFRYNIGENDGTLMNAQAGLFVWNSSEDANQMYNCEVYGNIIYNAKAVPISYLKQSESKGLRFYNNVFVGRDTLIRGVDKVGDAQYQGNNWWSLKNGFNIDGIKTIKAWALKTGKEQKNGKVIGLNIKPDFKAPGNANITSANQLKTFTNYQLPANSVLRNKPVYTDRCGIKNIQFK